ncbi:MAG: efflux RND transporter periplasmic adaptor subunit [Candidatus Polarisedimenticolaceae bacterium]|nr:efflux RND transporter periplasmic adaptor subunit [Candidatus Polarisedimenticolaceae bacterium]
MSWSGSAENAHGSSAVSITTSSKQKGPAGPQYGRSGPPKAEGHNKQPAVKARTIRLAVYQPQWNLYGEVITGHRVAVHLPVSGRLVHVSPKLREGAKIKRGDLLAAVDEFPYRAALEEAQATLSEIQARQKEIGGQITLEEHGLKQARRQLEPAQNELKRMQKLFKGGTVSQKMLDDAAVVVSQRESALQQRQSNIEISKARLQQQEAAEKRQQWGLQRARRALEDSRFIAPFDGRVLSVSAETGQYVTSSSKLATLVSSGDVEVRFTLSEDQYGDLLASGRAISGLPVAISWRSGRTLLTFDGEVKRVAAEITEESGAITLYAELDEEGLLKDQLPIGSFVDVTLSGHSISQVARVPESAIYDQNHLFLIEDSRLVSRQVEPLTWENGEVLISSGLYEGEQVLANHLPNARPGMQVKVIAQ